MWTCPKCNRSFRTQNQQHYCGKAPETIDEYIAEQVEEVQLVLHEIQKVIHEAIPEAEEKISWSMPTFKGKKNVIQFAAFKKHVSIFPGPEAVEFFQDRLREYKTSKGTIQFLLAKPIPYELIHDIAVWCWEKRN